jgi:hypothetical protein
LSDGPVQKPHFEPANFRDIAKVFIKRHNFKLVRQADLCYQQVHCQGLGSCGKALLA